MFPLDTVRGDPFVTKYYEQCIDKRIADCERKAPYETSSSSQLRQCATESQKEAAFLRANRDQLVAEMETDRVKLEEYKVNYYLIKAFHEVSD